MAFFNLAEASSRIDRVSSLRVPAGTGVWDPGVVTVDSTSRDSMAELMAVSLIVGWPTDIDICGKNFCL